MTPERKRENDTPSERRARARSSTGPCGLLIGLAAVTLGACAGPKAVGEWRSDYYDRGIENVLVIGATNGAERRRLLEDGLVSALRKDGITATHSYKLIPTAVGLTRESIEAAIRDQDIYTVMMIRLIGVREEETFQQTVERAGELSYFTITDKSLEQSETGYYEERLVLVLETKVFDTASQLLVFILRSELDDTTQSRQAIQAQIDLTIGRLRVNRLIGN